MAESLAEFFLTHFQAHRDERAYGQRRGYRMEWFTYGQVLEMAFWFCRELKTRGIGKGERVMLLGGELRGVGCGVFWMRIAGRCCGADG
jgi:hypothetical protein